jgi:hypothetical protein
VRGICGTSSPFLTGVGYFCVYSLNYVLHPNHTSGYCNSIEELEKYDAEHYNGEFWILPFHDACWKLLLDRVADCQGFNSELVVRNLFDILYCSPCDSIGRYIPGHDYNGAAQLQFDWLDRPPVPNESSTWSYVSADPREILMVVPTLPQQETSSKLPANSKLDLQNDSDMFSRLPAEIIITILNRLSSADVCSLRLSSKVLSEVSGPDALPQSFWASRFENDREMGFVFGGNCASEITKHPDWHQLYLTAKSRLRNTDQNQGFRNRRRIWQTLSNISRTLKPLFTTDHSPGQHILWGDSDRDGVTPLRPKAGRAISGKVEPADVYLAVGCRQLRTGSLIFARPHIPDKLCFGVSFIWFNSRFYVSGIRVWSSNSSPDSACALGLVIPESEKVVLLDSLDYLEGLEVSVNISGILGLRFLVKNPRGRSSHTTGDFDTNAAGVGIGKLLPQRGAQVYGITAGLDVRHLAPLYFILSLIKWVRYAN